MNEKRFLYYFSSPFIYFLQHIANDKLFLVFEISGVLAQQLSVPLLGLIVDQVAEQQR